MPDDARELIQRFLLELERLLEPTTEVFTLHLSGAAAVTLAYGGLDRTKDIDAVNPPEKFHDILKAKAGKNSKLHQQLGLFFEVVPPIFPRAGGLIERTRPIDVPGLSVLKIRVLDPHDLVISKLKRFSSGDQQDCALLCRLPEFDAKKLLRLYEDARAWYHYERDILEEIDTNFNRVRVEMLGLAPEDWSGEY